MPGHFGRDDGQQLYLVGGARVEEVAEEGGGVFAEFAVVGAEGSVEVGVDVEFADHFGMGEDGNDDFGFGFE